MPTKDSIIVLGWKKEGIVIFDSEGNIERFWKLRCTPIHRALSTDVLAVFDIVNRLTEAETGIFGWLMLSLNAEFGVCNG